MKKIMIAFLVGAGLHFSARADIIYPDGHAARQEPFEIKKLSHGVASVLLFPLEIPKAVADVGEEEGVASFQSLTLGIPRGLEKSMLRLSNGVYELTTVGEPTPPLWHLEPEYLDVWDALPGYHYQFNGWGANWETLDTPAYRMDQFDSPSWRNY